ncbi:MarC family protein [Treponema sp. OMZ 840]|uniref:MarC family protein n=1 Tax=Treponema sp. OMZ 840 TaxID=244313 RepID=UPI003D8AC6FA
MITESINEFFQLFFTVLIILDPIGIIPPFLAASGHFSAEIRKMMIRRSIIVAALVLVFFILFGRLILNFFGISPGAFYISGGILFFFISFEMIWSKPRSRQTPESAVDPHQAQMIAVFPLAIPLIAGPGMITTIILNMAASSTWLRPALMLSGAIGLGLIADYISLRCGTLLVRLIGTTGMYVVEKIMGLILAGLSVQLIYDGLIKLNIVSVPL